MSSAMRIFALMSIPALMLAFQVPAADAQSGKVVTHDDGTRTVFFNNSVDRIFYGFSIDPTPDYAQIESPTLAVSQLFNSDADAILVDNERATPEECLELGIDDGRIITWRYPTNLTPTLNGAMLHIIKDGVQYSSSGSTTELTFRIDIYVAWVLQAVESGQLPTEMPGAK
jgi:hypothetical protein